MPTAPAKRKRYFDPPRRLSRSRIWQLQRRFYDQLGPKAWGDAHVPSEITNNAFIARAYADVLLGFLRDLKAGDGLANEPLLIVELGAGTGRLSYLVAQELAASCRAIGLDPLPFRVVPTDFTEGNLGAYREHPRLAALAAEGLVDFARFDAEHPAAFTLERSGERIDAERPGGRAIALIANYVFDTVRHDAFWITGGVLHETRVALRAGRAASRLKPDDPSLLAHLMPEESSRTIRLPYYDDPSLDRLLAAYRTSFKECEFLLPVGALGCLRWFLQAAPGGLLVLCGDKGYRTDAELGEGVGVHFTQHGSISTMVNLNAIERYFAAAGGFALHAPQCDTGFTVSAFVQPGRAGEARELRHAYQRAIGGLGPRHYQTALDEIKRKAGQLSVPTALGLIRLSNWDQDIFLRAAPTLCRKAGRVASDVRADIAQVLGEVWHRYFLQPGDDDVAFAIGLVFYALRRFTEAGRYFEYSLGTHGPNEATYLNLGRAAEALGQFERARAYYTDGRKRLSDAERLRAALAKLDAKRRR